MRKIIIDRAILDGGTVTSSEAIWSNRLAKNFGATISNRFNNYKHCTFVMNERVKHGFADLAAFIQYFNDNFDNGTGNYKRVELTIQMEIDDKIPAPTLYAKNAKLGQYCGRNEYRKAVTVQPSASGFADGDTAENMRQLWLRAFGEDLTLTFINNHADDFKLCFWIKKDCDRMGVIKGGEIIDRNFGSYRKLYNSTDSDPASDTFSSIEIGVIDSAGQKLRAGNVATPFYAILDTNSGAYNAKFIGDLGDRYANTRGLAGSNYSVIAVHPVENVVSGKTYRAIYISPVGVDTIYFDYIDDTKYRFYSVKKHPNGNIVLKPINFSTGGGYQRIGRIRIGEWLHFDANDTGSESPTKGQGDVYFVYQDIGSGKFSPLSQSKMVQVKDLRFRVPFFHLVG